MYRAAGRTEEALEILDRLEEARGGRLGEAAPRFHYVKGVNAWALADTATALRSLRESVTRDPENAGAWITLSTVLRNLRAPDEALEAAERAAALVPESPQALSNLGAACEAAGDTARAVSAYRRVVEAGGASREILFRLGRALVVSGRDAEAERPLVLANEGQPHPEALILLARLYERTGRLEEARLAYGALQGLRSPYREEARERFRALGGDAGDGPR
jgi:Flp pilus assembly protein TadD